MPERVPRFEWNPLAISHDNCVAVEKQIHLFFPLFAVVVFFPDPARITADDGHTELVTVQRLPEKMHRVADRVHIVVVHFVHGQTGVVSSPSSKKLPCYVRLRDFGSEAGS